MRYQGAHSLFYLFIVSAQQELARNLVAWQQAHSPSWSVADYETAIQVETALKTVQDYSGKATCQRQQQGQGQQAGVPPTARSPARATQASPTRQARLAAGVINPLQVPPGRPCLDCECPMSAGEPPWKVRCLTCWRAWKAGSNKGGRRRHR